MAQQTAQASAPHQQAPEDAYEYHVSYSDSQTGPVRVEEFADLAAAERFASLQLRDAECWAIVERVDIHHHLRLVA
ncbi:hypothetical protein ACIQC5_04340 [Paenarthrobacter sp. NPDC092416]|uniref:hypothetical protein n=1 Tax=Paenarthrobacter sp. NPDC092416 TaxID=3364386 RepID=UPI003804B4E3